MSHSPPFDYRHYLAAKKTVDDRALNLHVAQALTRALASRPGPLAVLEVGAGIGTMVERLLERGIFVDAAYTALDHQAELLDEARLCLPVWARIRGWEVREEADHLVFSSGKKHFVLSFVAEDLSRFAADRAGAPRFDLLIAHHVLDLFNLDEVLPRLLALLRAGGLFYFTLNYDGATIILPVIEGELDRRIETLYHQAMERLDSGAPTPGASHTGRRLVTAIPAAGGHILAAGSSAWAVHPVQGQYPGDEAYFLHAIIFTIDSALAGHPALEPRAFHDWGERRHRQVEAGELTYIAHHLDFFGKVG